MLPLILGPHVGMPLVRFESAASPTHELARTKWFKVAPGSACARMISALGSRSLSQSARENNNQALSGLNAGFAKLSLPTPSELTLLGSFRPFEQSDVMMPREPAIS